MEKISSLGQYFTINNRLQEMVFKFIKNKPKRILEPSVGRGDLVNFIKKQNDKIKFDMYEIDNEIIPLESIDKKKINYNDFLKVKIRKKYKTIIGNPPYVKTSKGNLYIDFIKKCYKLLKLKGELIFIVPSIFLKLTSSSELINEMLISGTFTDIYHPNDEKLFKNASIDVIIFRYCRDNTLSNEVSYNDKSLRLINSNGIITFLENDEELGEVISKYFSIYVGMVSGKESIFKNNKLGNITILNKEDKEDKYILIDKFPTENDELNEYLIKNKEELISRRIKKFNEKNWFQWGALRNWQTIKENIGKKCIYINNITRQDRIAFIGKVKYFGGGLLIMIPVNDKINLERVCDYLNSEEFKKNYKYSGRFKIGHRQLSNHLIRNEILDF